MNMLKRLFDISRPVSWVNTAFPFAAGYLLLGGAVDSRLIVGTLFFLIPYNLLMYGVNDVYDYESDIKNPRKGGIEGAVTPKQYHAAILWSSGLLTLPFMVYLLASGTLVSDLTLVVVMFFVVAYSLRGLRFKEVPLLDSITSSSHFVGPLVFALALYGFPSQAWPYVIAFFCWGMASHAFGAVQDIIPDRQGKLASIATFFGAKWTVRFAFLLYLLAAALVIAQPMPYAVVGLVGLGYAVNICRYLDISDVRSPESNVAWRRFIWLNYLTGFVLTLTIIIANL